MSDWVWQLPGHLCAATDHYSCLTCNEADSSYPDSVCLLQQPHRFQNILVEVGFQGGVPIDEAFFRKHISGRHNPEIAGDLCVLCSHRTARTWVGSLRGVVPGTAAATRTADEQGLWSVLLACSRPVPRHAGGQAGCLLHGEGAAVQGHGRCGQLAMMADRRPCLAIIPCSI